ncbi:hypothetical protein [Bordetella bronchialis]|uniref:Uncharacterized protein n=1 Tax=Bordetella bronchialis TaxID=463025 RepID=A0A193FZI0_9BORD|nr:hypothetical protein [Bordetella bronchialis]ANN72596.1 hypothetical protein BAU08_15670 [Bordetella bronchialis]
MSSESAPGSAVCRRPGIWQRIFDTFAHFAGFFGAPVPQASDDKAMPSTSAAADACQRTAAEASRMEDEIRDYERYLQAWIVSLAKK